MSKQYGKDGKNGIDGDSKNWLKESLDSLWEKYDEMNTTLTRLTTTLQYLPKVPSRPCRELTEHLDDHKEIKRTITDKILGKIVDLAGLALVALITWYFTRIRN